jgi:hypothetical protein
MKTQSTKYGHFEDCIFKERREHNGKEKSEGTTAICHPIVLQGQQPSVWRIWCIEKKRHGNGTEKCKNPLVVVLS